LERPPSLGMLSYLVAARRCFRRCDLWALRRRRGDSAATPCPAKAAAEGPAGRQGSAPPDMAGRS
jgi:hypothetical protein